MSKIEWTEKTWNPIRGCTRVSAGCQNCYAERLAIRMSGEGQPYHGLVKSTARGPRWTGEVAFDPVKLYDPSRWRRPAMVFVNSMSDLFHERLSTEDIACVFAMMGSCPQHQFQVLTKRPARAAAFFEWAQSCIPDVESPWMNVLWEGLQLEVADDNFDGWFHDNNRMPPEWPFKNVWLGTSCENQAAFDGRVPMLLACPASIRWVSLEPLLGPIDMAAHIDQLDWVVVGGESGKGAGVRACDVGWIEHIVRQCRAAQVPVFVKQLGSMHPDHKAFDRWPGSIQFRGFPAALYSIRARQGCAGVVELDLPGTENC